MIRVSSERRLGPARTVAIGVLLALGLSGRTSTDDAYGLHLEKVRSELPPHSGLPPTVDLSRPGASDHAAGHAWENRFTGSMGVREHTDPGIQEPAGKGSISMTTSEFGGAWALPARSCNVIAMATPESASAHMAYNRRLVYSTFRLNIEEILKGRGKHNARVGKRLVAAQLGGTVRFPSGHFETFLLAQEGFLEPRKQYLLFMWKPITSDDTYVIAEPYLIDAGLVFPIKSVADVSAYDGMPLGKFEAKVKSAIAQNIDTN